MMKSYFLMVVVALVFGGAVIGHADERTDVEGVLLPSWAVKALSKDNYDELAKIISTAKALIPSEQLSSLFDAAVNAPAARRAVVAVKVGEEKSLRVPQYAAAYVENPLLGQLNQPALDAISQTFSRFEAIAASVRGSRPNRKEQGPPALEPERVPQAKATVKESVVPANVEPVPIEIPGIQNVSLSALGRKVAFCLEEDDQCAFRDPLTGITISSVAPEKQANDPDSGLAFNYQDAHDHCAELNWAGQEGWRLPSFQELKNISSKLIAITKAFPNFGENDSRLWTSGFPNEGFRGDALFSPEKAWTLMPSTGEKRHLPRRIKASFRCIKNDAQMLWRDSSTIENSTTPAECTEPHRECSFKLIRGGIQVTPPLSYLAGAPNQQEVTFATAKSYCEGLSWNGKRGWRLPSYEEGYDIGHSLYFGYLLSRDAVVELPTKRFWVTPPKSGEIAEDYLRPGKEVLFDGYSCHFQSGGCQRTRDVIWSYEKRYRGVTHSLPRNSVICVHD